MTYEEAKAINTSARRTGTLKFTVEQRAAFNEAREVMHQWSMVNEPGYARRFRDMYNRCAVGVGRMDLVGQCG